MFAYLSFQCISRSTAIHWPARIAASHQHEIADKRSVCFAWLLLVFQALAIQALLTPAALADEVYQFTPQDVVYLQQFSLQNLPPPPTDLGNRYSDQPQAAALGEKLFADTRLSANGKVACNTCHQPARAFTDGLAQSQGLGTTQRNAPSLLGVAYGPWKYWDGHKDSLWAQAIAPILASNEMAATRLGVAKVIVTHYRADYEALFGELSAAPAIQLLNEATAQSTELQQAITQVLVNVGKAIAAFERQLQFSPSRLDNFLQALQHNATKAELQKILTAEEVKGLRLFVGKADCASCHNGPLLSNFEFHNIGAPEANQNQVDLGRYAAIPVLKADEFNCLSRWSDAQPDACEELRFLKNQGPELVGAFKTPSLRNIAHTAPYMHAGQFKTLPEVVAHYNNPTPPFYHREQHPSRPHFDVLPLGLSDAEQQQLVAFLLSL